MPARVTIATWGPLSEGPLHPLAANSVQGWTYCCVSMDCSCAHPKVCTAGDDCDCGRPKVCTGDWDCNCGYPITCKKPECGCGLPKVATRKWCTEL